MNKKIRIPFDTKFKLNKHYIVEIPSTTMKKHDYRSIFGDHNAFIPMLLDRGSCFTLNDIECKITEFNFWSKEQFEDNCR